MINFVSLEENERQRRISQEIHKQLEESLESELNRRTSWLLEEEERIRRINSNAPGNNVTVFTAKLIRDKFDEFHKKQSEQLKL